MPGAASSVGLAASGVGQLHQGVPGPGRDEPSTVAVHLLGELQVVLGERPVWKWVSGRGRSVFEYLVIHSRRLLFARPFGRVVTGELR